MKNRVLVVGFALILLAIRQSFALDFSLNTTDPQVNVIVSIGEIKFGDTRRLVQSLGAAFFRSSSPVALTIDSSGGSIIEAKQIAGLLHILKVAVIVQQNATCASACFLILTAAPQKFVSSSAFVGVHSVSHDGQDDLLSMGFTTLFARDLAGYGVPESIIGKLVTRGSAEMAWLTGDDLRSVPGLVLVPPKTAINPPVDPLASLPPGYVLEKIPPANAPASQQPTESGPWTQFQSASFRAGLAARQEWESWFGALPGWHHLGAENWASVRSTSASKGACNADHVRQTHPDADEVNISDWLSGCDAARSRLAQPDRRRVTEPDYKAGWNSYVAGH